jgi:SAM-dependent methyltransferase
MDLVPDATFAPERYLRFYEPPLTDERSERETAALAGWLRLDAPADVIDLACGHGRHAIRMARRGHRVTGVDASAGFLERAARDAGDAAVTWRRADMRAPLGTSCCDAGYCVFTAFGYFDDAGNRAVLEQVARALRPGGRFVIETINRDNLLRRLSLSSIQEVDGDWMLDRSTWDPVTGRISTARTCLVGGERHDVAFQLRLPAPSELAAWCAAAGLEVEQWLGDWQGQALGLDSHRLIAVLRKPAPP